MRRIISYVMYGPSGLMYADLEVSSGFTDRLDGRDNAGLPKLLGDRGSSGSDSAAPLDRRVLSSSFCIEYGRKPIKAKVSQTGI